MRTKTPSLSALRKIRLFAMDVDGVLTDGGLLVLNSGEEVKVWSVKDRIAFFVLKKLGGRFKVAWITGRGSRQVADQAKEVGVRALYQKCEDKGLALAETLRRLGLRRDECLFIGDDLVDLPAFLQAGLSVCPADAHSDVKRRCGWVTEAPGGRGVFREVVDRVLAAQGLRGRVLAMYARPARAAAARRRRRT